MAEYGREQCTSTLHNIYDMTSDFFSVNEATINFSIERGVKLGDPIFPKLFSAVKWKCQKLSRKIRLRITVIEKGEQLEICR